MPKSGGVCESQIDMAYMSTSPTKATPRQGIADTLKRFCFWSAWVYTIMLYFRRSSSVGSTSSSLAHPSVPAFFYNNNNNNDDNNENDNHNDDDDDELQYYC